MTFVEGELSGMVKTNYGGIVILSILPLLGLLTNTVGIGILPVNGRNRRVSKKQYRNKLSLRLLRSSTAPKLR